MKKQLLIINCFLLISCALYAQKKQSRFFTELGIGPSFPIGDFAKKTYDGTDNNLPGFAKVGIGGSLSAGYHINESLGLLVTGGYSINPQDEKAYKNYIRSKVSNINNISVEAKNWNIIKLMAGGFFVTPLTADSTLVLRTKLTVGVCKTALPAFEYGYTRQTAIDTTQGGSSLTGLSWQVAGNAKRPFGWTFCYQISIGLKFTLNKNLYALFDISSFNATATTTENEYGSISPVSVISGSGPIPTSSQTKRKFRLGSVNAQAGVGLSF